MKRRGWWLGAVIAASLCTAAAHAQPPQEFGAGGSLGPAPGRPPQSRPMFAPESAATARRLEPHERDERHLLKDAAASSRFQVDAARLVLAKSANAGVRSLATTLSSQHQAAGDELLRLLHQRGLAAPMLQNTQRKALTRLQRLQGARLDREYADAAAAQAQEELELCEKAVAGIQDAALAAWVARITPELRYQIESAQRVAAGLPAVRAPRQQQARPKHAPRRVSGSGSR